MPQMKPILFNTEMVKENLEGRKTATRRVVKPQPPASAQFIMGICSHGDYAFDDSIDNPGQDDRRVYMAPYNPGDVLYVRETWGYDKDNWIYKADFSDSDIQKIRSITRWRPSIHMPKKAARIFLWVTDVRVERLQESFFCHGATVRNLAAEGIDIGDQCRECIETYGSPCCIDAESECGILDDVRDDFAKLWDSTIKPTDLSRYGWSANPWVWVIEYKRITKEEAYGN